VDDIKRKKKAKRPPPTSRPKRVPIRQKVTIEKPADEVGRPSKTKIEIQADAPTTTWIRHLAATNYVTDPDGRSVRWHYENDPRCHIVALDTMERWAAVDGWVERRRQFVDKLNKKAEGRMANVLFQERLKDLRNREALLREARNRLMPEDKTAALPSNSFESLLNAYTRLSTEVDDMRQKLADTVLPGVLAAPVATDEESGQAMHVRPQLSEDEKRAAASVILKIRRDKHRAALRAKEAEDAGEEPANLRVIDGEK
jgi:hypothetical protein